MKSICVCKSCRKIHYKGKRAKSWTTAKCDICGSDRNCINIQVDKFTHKAESKSGESQ